MTLAILFFASLWAGVQNALAGGGSFITLPALMLTGMDSRAANITSTIALFPAQIAMGWTGRDNVSGAAGLSLRTLVIVSLIGGALGAILLLVTPASFFARLVPWLVRSRRNSGSRSMAAISAAASAFSCWPRSPRQASSCAVPALQRTCSPR